MPVSITFNRKSIILKSSIEDKKSEEEKKEEKKEECLEPVKCGKGLLQEALSSLKFNDTPIRQIIKGSRNKKRNISFTY